MMRRPGNHVPPRFLDRVALHIAKNALVDTHGPWSVSNEKPPLVGEVPLLLGVWGPKGAGKSYNLELCLRQRDSGDPRAPGELEDPLAGVPGRTIHDAIGAPPAPRATPACCRAW